MCFQSYQQTASLARDAFSSNSDHLITENSYPHLLLPSLVTGSLEKAVECLNRMAALYAQTGDYRKCEVYSLCALNNSSNGLFERLKPNVALSELLSVFKEQPPKYRQELTCRRCFFFARATASTYGSVLSDLQNAMTTSGSPVLTCSKNTSRYDRVEELRVALLGMCISSGKNADEIVSIL